MYSLPIRCRPGEKGYYYLRCVKEKKVSVYFPLSFACDVSIMYDQCYLQYYVVLIVYCVIYML